MRSAQAAHEAVVTELRAHYEAKLAAQGQETDAKMQGRWFDACLI